MSHMDGMIITIILFSRFNERERIYKSVMYNLVMLSHCFLTIIKRKS